MAAILGNVPLPIDLYSPAKISGDRKLRLVSPFDVVLALRREKEFPVRVTELDGDQRIRSRGKSTKFSKKANAVEYSSDEENGNGNRNGEDDDEDEEEEEEEMYDWEVEMRRTVKEIEDMRELEKKAEELQRKKKKVVGDDDDERESVVDETEQEKKMRVRKELEKVAKEQAERRETAKLMFELGQKAYGRGMYRRAIEFLEAALTIIPRSTLYGGEIQIWLAMAYEANNRHADCIALYRQLEQGHPSVAIRRQAADLRYIMQAPKIKITQEEMVTIPLIGSSYDSYASTWTDKEKDKDNVIYGSTTNQLPSSRDYIGDFMRWKPPVGWEKNQVFWAAVTLWLGLVGTAIFLQR